MIITLAAEQMRLVMQTYQRLPPPANRRTPTRPIYRGHNENPVPWLRDGLSTALLYQK